MPSARHSTAKKGRKLFQKGAPKPPGSGRKPGQKSRVTLMLQETILLAASNVGSDGKGKGELLGYLEDKARRFPKQYLSLIAKVLPHKIEGGMNTKMTFETKEEVIEEMKRRNLPIPQFMIPQKIIDAAARPSLVVVDGKKKRKDEDDE